MPNKAQGQTDDSTSQLSKPSRQEIVSSQQSETDNADIQKTDKVQSDQMGVSHNSKQVVHSETDLALQQGQSSAEISDAGNQHSTSANTVNPIEEQNHNTPSVKSETDETEVVEGADQDSERDASTFQDTEMGDGINSDRKPDIGKKFQDLPNETDLKDINNGRTQDSIIDDEDDHFFTLFLIGVIFVILLYVLYHNKNKVSKMVMGLIVEGRAGRRRNSRGHAYRRLDTLEQAVSASHPTPPTKIIY
ncbi:Trans-Golgi network integral membrane protein 2 [Eumeta japonica]|uniref:Trans-Golgi network integral membrane protein 2 n=1 Tax=Eumeta variegata TaxID=151549 RepID=A0A4C1UP81_EUMVA|nr:Trans-Golgi network integral membrane protein 2 [Eumeta japonica]